MVAVHANYKCDTRLETENSAELTCNFAVIQGYIFSPGFPFEVIIYFIFSFPEQGELGEGKTIVSSQK